MAVLDEPEGETDPMRRHARFLDVTLDAARDMLVAHRDPELLLMRSATNLGAFSLHLTTLDEARIAAAVNVLRTMPFPVPQPQLDKARRGLELESAISTLLDVAGTLGPKERAQLRRVYRLGGLEAPDMTTIALRVGKLLDLYIDARGLTTSGSQ